LLSYGERSRFAHPTFAPREIIGAGGVPARAIRKRFPEAVAERLQRIGWWNWPDDVIFERLADFRSGQIELFCDRSDPALASRR
jgi:hypothetical protein